MRVPSGAPQYGMGGGGGASATGGPANYITRWSLVELELQVKLMELQH